MGQANYTAYEEKIKSRIRTYQAAANLYSNVRSMLASAEDIAQETGINVAQIGNALRDSNTVETDSEEKTKLVTAFNESLRRLSRIKPPIVHNKSIIKFDVKYRLI